MALPRPSAGTVLGGIALFVALGGTAAAATGTVVNIADPATASHVARVDVNGALKAAPSPPVTPAYFSQPVNQGTSTLIPATGAKLAITRITVDNYFGNVGPVYVVLSESSGSKAICDGSSGVRTISSIDVPVGQTFEDELPTPIVLKPFVAGGVWCLQATVQVQGAPISYVAPDVQFSGYVTSGTLPFGFTSRPAGKTTIGPKHVTGRS